MATEIKNQKYDIENSWELSEWILKLRSVPKEIIISRDCGEGYETQKRHIFKLENGKYAVIKEHGCSCYNTSDAEIEIFSNLKEAKESFQKHDYAPEKWKLP